MASNTQVAPLPPQPRTGVLTNAQLEMLKAFSLEVPQEVIDAMHQVYIQYLGQQITEQVDQVFEENEWGEEKLEEWKNAHFRTPYNPA